jgi:hypothetical protein
METNQQQLYEIGQIAIRLLEKVILFAEEKELTNSQTLLNILDKINELSVKY